MVRQQATPRTASETLEGGCDDPALVRHAQSDLAAFTVLFNCFWSLVVRYCYGRLRSWPDAEDAAQTVFLNAILHLPGFEQRPQSGGVRSWLLRIAHNETITTTRSWQRRTAVPFPEASFVDPGPRPEEIAVDLAVNEWVADLCARLSKDQREVMQLRFAGLTTREIALTLGKSEKAIQKATERATDRLQQLVATQDGDRHDR
jgi:RNA polymerase sigma-70 factor (ECF subfamily)